MPPNERTARWFSWVAIAGALVALVQFVLQHAFSIYDDAYIYFRYADNLTAGCGLAFNCGSSPVEGFTSPLYLGLLWLGALLTGDVEAWSQLLGTASLAAALVLAIRLARVRGETASASMGAACALAVAGALAADHHLLLNAVSGLETPLAAACIVALAGAVLRKDRAWTVTWVLVGVLLRPECGVFVLLLPTLPWMRTRRAVITVLAALGVITALRWMLFGDVLPNTYWAKSGGTTQHAELGLSYLEECVRTFPLLVLAPCALLSREGRREHAYLLGGMAVWCAYFLRTGGDHFAYARLVVPLVPTATALAFIGIANLPRPKPVRIRMGLLAALALATGLHAALRHNLPSAHGFPNVQRWSRVGRWLKTHHRGDTMATIPVGAMAYTSGLPTLDLVGITTAEVARSGNGLPPELVRRAWLGHERHNTPWVLEQAPELIVTTKFRDHPWRHLGEVKAGFYADWLVLQEIKAGRAPYDLYSAQIEPGVHWLMYRRRPSATP
ncbi:MAG: hypothetical protein ACRBN8_36825 [Nannocystales bacterium]